jgi:hypothetical protein
MRPNALAPTHRASAAPSTTQATAPMRTARRGLRGLIATGVILLLTLAIIAPEPGVRALGALINLSAAEVPAGAEVGITGTGFSSGQEVAIVFDESEQLGGARADGAGGFSIVVSVPASALPGTHRVAAMAAVSRPNLLGRAGLAAAVLASAGLLVVALQPSPSNQSASPTNAASSSPATSGEAGPSSTMLATSVPGGPSASASASGTEGPAVTPAPPTSTPVPTPKPLPSSSQPSLPVRAAFYYPWFPEAWNQQGMNPFTHYHPSLGFYDSSASATIRQHIQAMQYGGIKVGISSWWGVGTRSDVRVPTILANTAGSSFRWSLYYEQEAQGDPAVSQIASDLRYIRDHYAVDPSFFKVNGRFVVFVYTDGADACAMATRWSQANVGIDAYVVLKVFSGFKTCAAQPAGWHQYAPAKAADAQVGYSYAISPGFNKANEASARLARDLARWAQNVQDMVASGAPFQLITTFNEWGEGTSVESATEWATASGFGAYLDLLHTNGR